MAEGRKTGGRKKGTPNKRTQERAKAAERAAEAVSAMRSTRAASSLPFDETITPKEVMLKTMRNAWHEHKVLNERAILATDEAREATADAKELRRGSDESSDAFEARKKAAEDTASKARDIAATARLAASAALNLALQCSKDAAPYEHAKLQTSTVSGDLNLTIIRREFKRPEKKAA